MLRLFVYSRRLIASPKENDLGKCHSWFVLLIFQMVGEASFRSHLNKG